MVDKTLKREAITDRQLIQSAKNKEELLATIDKLGHVKGSTKTYSSQELRKSIERVFEVYEGRTVPSAEKLNSNMLINKITREEGLREKVIELLHKKEEQKESDQKSAGRTGISHMVNKARLNYNLRRAEAYEALAADNESDKSRAKYYSKAGKYREKAAEFLEKTGQNTNKISGAGHQLRGALDDYIKAAEYWRKSGHSINAYEDANSAYNIAQRLGNNETSLVSSRLKTLLSEGNEYFERKYRNE
jgi:hypothetical protein